MDLSRTTLVVLAGGMGTRMGQPKAWLTLEGQPILDRLLQRLHWPGPTMLVSAPSLAHPPGHELFDCEVFDSVEGQGPLQGLLAALENMSTPVAAAVTVDMPLIALPSLSWVVESLADRPECSGVMCYAGEDEEAHIEPFPSAFRASAGEAIQRRLEAGKRSVRGLCQEEAFAALKTPANWPADTWMNINTRNDLAAFEVAQSERRTEQAK